MSKKNPINIDPSKTLIIRKKAEKQIEKMFAKIKKKIIKLIVEEDSLGLKNKPKLVPPTDSLNPTLPVTNLEANYSLFVIAETRDKSILDEINRISSLIPSKDIIKITDNPHITIQARIDKYNGVYQEIKECIKSIPQVSFKITGVSLFENEDQDVLKFDVESDSIQELHNKLDTLPNSNTYDKFIPHLTIAYLQKGTGKKIKQITKLLGYSYKVDKIIVYEKTSNGKFIPISNARWKFLSSPQKLKQFKEWLKNELYADIVGITEEEAWNRFIREGYELGAGRAFDEIRLADLRRRKPELFTPEAQNQLRDFYQGSKEEFLKSAFANPIQKERLELLVSRSFEGLRGITDEIASKLTAVLADGLTQGKNPRTIARDLTSQLDIDKKRALTISRTEIVRAQAEGQLSSMEELGVKEVGVMVEWLTAGDARVCKLCKPLEGIVLKLEEAKGMLPRHPNCRCAWIPANVGEDTEGQKRGKAKIKQAIKKSAKEEGIPALISWSGIDTPIARSRPIKNNYTTEEMVDYLMEGIL